MLNIVLFGPPGAGKGTQSQKIIKKYGLIHLSTGQLMREHIAKNTDLGKQAQEDIDNGKLAPDNVAISIVKEQLDKARNPKGFIFDGFPRTVNQAIALDKLLKSKGWDIDALIMLEVDREELINRITRRSKTSGRVDDQDLEKIFTRIQVYKDQTLPVANYYKEQGKYEPIEGSNSIEGIFEKICSILDRYAS